MHRPLRALFATALSASIATAVVVSGASLATGATPDSSASLSQAASTARANASAALGGLALPAGTHAQLRAASKASKVESIDFTVPVVAKSQKYDIHVVSVGKKTDPTHIRLYLGTSNFDVAVRKFVRLTVRKHGAKTDVLRVTTSFRRYVVMQTALQTDPLSITVKKFHTRTAMISTLAQGLSLNGAELTRQYGAVLRFAQMGLDLSATLLDGVLALAQDPSLTDFSTVVPTHTTLGSGAYDGSVTLTGTPTAFSVQAINLTDGSTLTEALSPTALTITYTIGGKTYTEAVDLVGSPTPYTR